MLLTWDNLVQINPPLYSASKWYISISISIYVSVSVSVSVSISASTATSISMSTCIYLDRDRGIFNLKTQFCVTNRLLKLEFDYPPSTLQPSMQNFFATQSFCL